VVVHELAGEHRLLRDSPANGTSATVSTVSELMSGA